MIRIKKVLKNNFKFSILLVVAVAVVVTGEMRAGSDFQAKIPECVKLAPNERAGMDKALLVWSPNEKLSDDQVEDYLNTAREKYVCPPEQALGLLFRHKHDVTRATSDLGNFTPNPEDWTMKDKVLFEQAYQFHGKAFDRIRQMLPDKSMSSLIRYYYTWKKPKLGVLNLETPKPELSRAESSKQRAAPKEDGKKKAPKTKPKSAVSTAAGRKKGARKALPSGLKTDSDAAHLKDYLDEETIETERIMPEIGNEVSSDENARKEITYHLEKSLGYHICCDCCESFSTLADFANHVVLAHPGCEVGSEVNGIEKVELLIRESEATMYKAFPIGTTFIQPPLPDMIMRDEYEKLRLSHGLQIIIPELADKVAEKTVISEGTNIFHEFREALDVLQDENHDAVKNAVLKKMSKEDIEEWNERYCKALHLKESRPRCFLEQQWHKLKFFELGKPTLESLERVRICALPACVEDYKVKVLDESEAVQHFARTHLLCAATANNECPFLRCGSLHYSAPSLVRHVQEVHGKALPLSQAREYMNGTLSADWWTFSD